MAAGSSRSAAELAVYARRRLTAEALKDEQEVVLE